MAFDNEFLNTAVDDIIRAELERELLGGSILGRCLLDGVPEVVEELDVFEHCFR